MHAALEVLEAGEDAWEGALVGAGVRVRRDGHVFADRQALWALRVNWGVSVVPPAFEIKMMCL
ncbi:MAG TPA: hypothetical protein VGI03_13155 [Verrucomicrobiae bacterium]|jgi:hypothetical protein